MTKIYIAGPLFSTHERWYLEQIEAAFARAGYETFLPHRENRLLHGLDQDSFRQAVYQADMAGLASCQVIVALLTGADHDSGTCGELGLSAARGYPCFGISDDPRSLNIVIWGLCNEGKHISRTIEGCVEMVKAVVAPDTQ